MIKYLGYLVEAMLFGVLLGVLNYFNIPFDSKEKLLILAIIWAVLHVVITNIIKKKSTKATTNEVK